MKACVLICLAIVSALGAFASESSPMPATQPETYELRLWLNAWNIPNREPDIRANIAADTHFFERQILPTGELHILTGVLHAPTNGKFRLDFTLFQWTSSRSNLTDTMRTELQLDKPYGFLTGSSVITGHMMLLTKTKTP